ncbi:MAG: divalent metal cation transporter [Thaumarchaeota archaeon]|nr:divalent metal cation transporter [Nitrososphaerota archaeon]
MGILGRLSRFLGPGLISGASDDDPSGIVTYAQGGAMFGLGLTWMALFQFPLLTAIQEMCARIGLATGSGIMGIVRRYHKTTMFPVLGLLLTANAITIGVDIGAMGSSVQILFPGLPLPLITVSFASFILVTAIFFSYQRYARMLKFTVLALFSYVIAAFVMKTDWSRVFFSTFVPHFEFTRGFLMMFVAFFGATMSPYAFFWQASEEAEEDISRKKIKEMGKGTPRVTKKDIRIMRAENVLGMAFSQIIMWFIIIATANALHTNNTQALSTADQIARSLEPMVHDFPNAGKAAEVLFAVGIIGTGLLAVPVLASSSAYAMSESLGWKRGLSKKFGQARGFYMIIIISTAIGLLMNLIHIDPATALVYASMISGVMTVPLLVVILRISNDKRILGGKTNGPLSNILGWLTVVIMGASSASMFVLFLL